MEEVVRDPFARRVRCVELGEFLIQPGHESHLRVRGALQERRPMTLACGAVQLRQPLREALCLGRVEPLGDDQVDTLLAMFRYYERFGMAGNPRVLANLLGREPTSLARFLERQIGSSKAS